MEYAGQSPLTGKGQVDTDIWYESIPCFNIKINIWIGQMKQKNAAGQMSFAKCDVLFQSAVLVGQDNFGGKYIFC